MGHGAPIDLDRTIRINRIKSIMYIENQPQVEWNKTTINYLICLLNGTEITFPARLLV